MQLDDFIYTRKDLGQFGKPISVYKIRTMIKQADSMLETLIQENGFDGLGKLENTVRFAR